jgi:hypothetical protein
VSRLASLALALLACTAAVAAGDQAAAPAPRPSGAIAGTLISADLGLPVRRAQVRLVSASPRVTRTGTTDANGRFAFGDLPAADYTLSAAKAGYLEMVYGARRPGARVAGTPIRLAAGEKLDTIALRIPRGGVISGNVVDEFGDAAFGVPVRALRLSVMMNGERTATSAGQAVTDDLGGYRIAGLLPGEYVVSAVPRDTVAAEAGMADALRARAAEVASAGRTNADLQRLADATKPPSATGYVPVYFGGTTSPSAATRVTLGVSAHAGGVDLKLELVKTAQVSGTLTNPDGTPASGRVQLIDPAMPIANIGVWFRNATPGGKFSFAGLVPGAYIVTAEVEGSTSSGGPLTASTTVEAVAGDVADVRLSLQRGVSVSGRLDLDAIKPPIDFRKTKLELLPIPTAADWEMPMRFATPDAEGRFALNGVAPGRYRVTVAGLPDAWSVATAVFAGKDAADYLLDVGRGENVTDGIVTFTARPSEVSGVTSNAAGEPVADRTIVLFPSDRNLWLPQSRRIHVTQPGQDGRYRIRTLPPGEYLVAAVDAPEAGEQFDPAFLAQLVAAATPVTLAAGQQRTIDIQVR